MESGKKRLLITTQAVDRDDPILGFFHGWIIEFAQHFERVEVICLREGKHELPSNVRVFSLGKETGEDRLKYVRNFFRTLHGLGREYDIVFSHMNPHYIVLAGWLWKWQGTPIYFWRNHAKMNLMTRIAAFFAAHVFYTSPYACTRVFKHSIQMPVGIDTVLFAQNDAVERVSRSVLFLGRLSPVKRPELFARACTHLHDAKVSVYGDADKRSSITADSLQAMSATPLNFYSAIPNYETPRVYSSHEIYVNLTPEGSMDKTILEAAACGVLPLVSNRSFEDLVPEACVLQSDSPEAIAEKMEALMSLPGTVKETYRERLRSMVERQHSLKALVSKFVAITSDN